MRKDEVRIKIGAGIELKSLQVIEVLFFVVASNHLCDFIGISIPLLLLILTDIHALEEIVDRGRI